MPHLIVEYSGNLEKQLDMPAILRVVHDAALATGVFPFGGIRTRGERRDLYLIADATFVFLPKKINFVKNLRKWEL